MECNTCSKDGDLVYMEKLPYNKKTGANEYECPRCGRNEVSGFGIIA